MGKISRFTGGGLIYSPALVSYDGSTNFFEDDGPSCIGWTNASTMVGQFRIGDNSGDSLQFLGRLNGSSVGTQRVSVMVATNDYTANTEIRDKLRIFIKDADDTTPLVDVVSETSVNDDELHTFFVSYDGATGSLVFILDGQEADDASYGSRALASGTLEADASGEFIVGGSSVIGALYWPGEIGFIGYDDQYLTNWQDFFDGGARPQPQDETTWANSGWGSQPRYWNEHGNMYDNKGSESNCIYNGTFALAEPIVYPGLGLNTVSDSGAEAILVGRKAWADGVELDGAAYTPAMMEYGGVSDYYSKTTPSFTGNKVSFVCRFNRASFSGTGEERIAGVYPANGWRFLVRVWADAHATTTRRRKLSLFAQSSTAITICNVFSSIVVDDGENHTLLTAFDADNGTAVMVIDGVDVLDTGNAEHTLTTGTLATAAAGDLEIGRQTSNPFTGSLGFIGYDDQYLTNWSDFMYAGGRPKEQDESAWANSGFGSQPLYWNEHGYMLDNKGSVGNLTANGTIVVGKGGNG